MSETRLTRISTARNITEQWYNINASALLFRTFVCRQFRLAAKCELCALTVWNANDWTFTFYVLITSHTLYPWTDGFCVILAYGPSSWTIQTAPGPSPGPQKTIWSWTILSQICSTRIIFEIQTPTAACSKYAPWALFIQIILLEHIKMFFQMTIMVQEQLVLDTPRAS